MALDFPSSPTNGQLFGNWTYDSSAGAWRKVPDVAAGLPAGVIMAWATNTAPANWLICDGSAVNRKTYASLFAAIGTNFGVGDGSTTFNIPDLRGRVPVGKNSAITIGTATITIAAPGVVTATSHGLANGFKVYFTTTGALPTGITASTEYFVVNATTSTFQISATFGGTAITTTGTQSGTHTLFSSDFDLGETGGEKAHPIAISELPDFVSPYQANTGFIATSVQAGASFGFAYKNSQGVNGSGVTHNNLQPYQVVNYIIKSSVGATAADSQLATRVATLESNFLTNTQVGLKRAIPSSIAVSGGAAVVDANGDIRVTTNGPTAISLNDLFLPGKSYRFQVSTLFSAATNLAFRTRLSGTDNSTGDYVFGGFFTSNSWPGSATASAYGSATTNALVTVNGQTQGDAWIDMSPLVATAYPSRWASTGYTRSGSTGTYCTFTGDSGSSGTRTGITFFGGTFQVGTIIRVWELE